jgi:hypothetical protein
MPAEFNLYLLSLPLLLIDWQLAIVWGLMLLNDGIVTYLLGLDFGGLEVFFAFVSLGLVRLLIFKRRNS